MSEPIVCLKCGSKEFVVTVEGRYTGTLTAKFPDYEKLTPKWKIEDQADYDDVDFVDWDVDREDDDWKCKKCGNSDDFLFLDEYLEAKEKDEINYINSNQMKLFEDGVEGKDFMVIYGKRIQL